MPNKENIMPCKVKITTTTPTTAKTEKTEKRRKNGSFPYPLEDAQIIFPSHTFAI